MAETCDRQGVTIHCGDALEVLKTLPSESVNCCVTSPPYWGLRDYGVDGQLGLEATPSEYVAKMVAVFEEVRRVLRVDGTCWVNMGDSYCNAGSSRNGEGLDGTRRGGATGADGELGYKRRDIRRSLGSIKHKDLIGVPWTMAFALRDAGWYLRQDIIWAKPSPMPESVRDRCTKAHEYIFLLAKSPRYYFDAEAIAEPCVHGEYFHGGYSPMTPSGPQRTSSRNGRKQRKPAGWDTGEGAHGRIHRNGRAPEVEYTETEAATRNKRSVWTVTSEPYPAAHFATFPTKLIEPCILAGCPEGGTVLDPFIGSGTTAQVARKLGRKCIGIELNPEYIELCEKRLEQGVLF